jgi:hypothetical protein
MERVLHLGLSSFRGIFLGYNEDRLKGKIMKNKKLERLLVKLGVMALGTLACGAAYRSAQMAEDAVDEKYEKNHNIKPGRLI